jgi:hypothetical protein
MPIVYVISLLGWRWMMMVTDHMSNDGGRAVPRKLTFIEGNINASKSRMIINEQ